DASAREDRGGRLVGEGGSLHAGTDAHERPGGGRDALAVELERRAPLRHDVELLVTAGLVLVVLVDDPVAHVTGGPGVDAECGDPEVVPHRAVRAPTVVLLVDLVELRDCVLAHGDLLRSPASSASLRTGR